MNNQYNYQQTQTPRKESKFLSFLKGIGYFVIYLAITNIVASAIVMLFYSFPKALEFTSGTGEVTQESFETFYEEILTGTTEYLNKNAMAITLVANLFVIGIFALIFKLRNNRTPNITENKYIFRKPELSKALIALIAGITLNFAVNPLLNIVLMFLPEDALASYLAQTELYSNGGLVVFIIGGIILAPIAEEFVLRGAVTSRFGRAMNPHIAILLSSAMFGLMHGHVVQFFYTFPLGLILGYVFRRNGLFVSIILHFGFNLASLPVMVLEEYFPKVYNSDAFAYAYRITSYIMIPAAGLLLFFLLRKKKVIEE